MIYTHILNKTLKAIKLFLTIAFIVSISLSTFLFGNKLTDTVRSNATANCPSGYTWNGTQCEARVNLNSNTSYSCPNGGNVNGANCDLGIGSFYNSTSTCGSNHYLLATYTFVILGGAPDLVSKICAPIAISGFQNLTVNTDNPSASLCGSNHYFLVTDYTFQLGGTQDIYSIMCVPNSFAGFTSTFQFSNKFSPSSCDSSKYAVTSGWASSSDTSLSLCVPNTVSYSATSNTTYSCPSGYTQDAGNPPCVSYTSALSFTCPAGQYLTNQATDSCAPCPAGSYCTGGVGAVAVACSAGNYCLAGVSSQTPCPAGSYCASVSQAPVACSAGNYCPALATTQTQCPVNNYCLAGASSPTPCPANYSSPAGSSSLSACIPNNTTLSLKLNLSSVFTDSTDTLGCDLRTRDLLPTTQPYNNPTYNYTGTEVLPNSNLATDICDWILITLSDSTTNNVVATKAALVKTNGTVIDAINATTSNTTTGVNFSTLTPANYKVTIRHRNHLGISTNTPVAFTPASTTTIDFTTNTNVKGSNQAEVGIVGPTNTTYNASALPGAVGSKIYALRQADSNNNGQVDAADRTLLSNSQEYDGVYDNKDLNLDGSIDASDRAITQLAPEASENL